MQKSELRALLRKRRQALSLTEQAAAAQALSQQLQQLPELSTPQNIGLYFPSDGEISPLSYVTAHPEHNYYLPSLSLNEKRLLHFHPWHAEEPIQYNHLNVAEPVAQQNTKEALALDVIFMPLVGFDKTGTRLGMGGGFYDYTLRHWQQTKTRPCLIGIAHSCQYYEGLQQDPWDIPLDTVITEKETFIFPRA